MVAATPTMTLSVNQVGEMAGLVWKTLNSQGPLSLAKLAKMIDAPRDVVMMAVGWLAHEGKLNLEDAGKGRVVCLCD